MLVLGIMEYNEITGRNDYRYHVRLVGREPVILINCKIVVGVLESIIRPNMKQLNSIQILKVYKVNIFVYNSLLMLYVFNFNKLLPLKYLLSTFTKYLNALSKEMYRLKYLHAIY